MLEPAPTRGSAPARPPEAPDLRAFAPGVQKPRGPALFALGGLLALLWTAPAAAQTAEPLCTPGPATLSGDALKQELARHARDQRTERERLEKLKAEITEARAALTEEIARLEDAIARAAKVEEEQRRQDAENPPGPVDPIAQKKLAEKIAKDRVRLAKALKSMPPVEAAKLLKALDLHLAADLLAKMRPQEAGMVLAAMKPSDAAKLTSLVAGDGPPR